VNIKLKANFCRTGRQVFTYLARLALYQKLYCMKEPFTNKERKSFGFLKMVYHITASLIILGMAVLMFMGKKWNIPRIATASDEVRYMFGGLCALYGSFRMYRAFLKD
jgi:uncharacterized membrane protein